MKKQGVQPGAAVPPVRFPVYEFLILFLPVAVLVVVVGYSFASMRTESQIEAVLDDDATRLQHISGFIGAEVSGSLNHLLAIAAESTTIRAMDAADASRHPALEASLLTLARRNPFYQQVRWIDETGRERVRVSRNQGGPFVEKPDALQNKSQRYYVVGAQALLPGEVFISPIDLNVEHGQIEMPANPVLRVATPAVDSQREAHGVIIANIAMHHILDAIDDMRQRAERARFLLLNRDGQVLNVSGTAGNTADSASQDHVFSGRHPRVWGRIKASASGSTEADNGLWTWSRVTPAAILRNMRRAYPEHAAVIDQVIAEEFELTLVAHRPIDFLVELRRDSRVLVSLGTLLGLSVYGVSMFLYLSGHVRERRAELQAGYAMARAENAERMRKLEERFHRLFETSSIGQLVIDAEGQIELGNPAAEQLLGYGPGQLNGLSVDKLLPEEKRTRHAEYRAHYLGSPAPRKMGEGRELEALTRQGKRVPVEIGLNPYQDGGRQLVLVSIVDLTRRDRPAQ